MFSSCLTKYTGTLRRKIILINVNPEQEEEVSLKPMAFDLSFISNLLK